MENFYILEKSYCWIELEFSGVPSVAGLPTSIELEFNLIIDI